MKVSIFFSSLINILERKNVRQISINMHAIVSTLSKCIDISIDQELHMNSSFLVSSSFGSRRNRTSKSTFLRILFVNINRWMYSVSLISPESSNALLTWFLLDTGIYTGNSTLKVMMRLPFSFGFSGSGSPSPGTCLWYSGLLNVHCNEHVNIFVFSN